MRLRSIIVPHQKNYNESCQNSDKAIITMPIYLMRFYTVVLLICLSGCSRYTIEDGTYFTGSQDCMIVDGKQGLLEYKCGYVEDNLIVKQSRYKIIFRKKAYQSRILPFLVKWHRYKFRILDKTPTTFSAEPATKRTKKYFERSAKIEFKLRKEFADETNYFTRIIYHSSHCYGCCSDLHLELDYSGNLKVTDNGRGWMKGCEDSILNDNYFGKVSYDDMGRLKNILKYSQLKTLEWPETRACVDAPDITMIIYQNEKRYYFKINQPCLPVVSWQLTGFLNRLFRYESLKRMDTTFVYER